MLGLLKQGNKVWLTRTDNPKRKLKYTLQIIQVGKSKVGVNTHLTNKIVLDALKNNLIKEINDKIEIKPEKKFGTNTRFDFFISKKNYKAFIEVKNVTLLRNKGIAEFPDAVTSRGLKHINELIKAYKKGYKIFILYLIQREDCKFFTIAKDIDPEYSNSLSKAVKKKLNILCYDCKFSTKGIKLNKKVNFKI
jgi:sugar fermentation stimulation protein A